jgi:hypothetical protein
LVLVEQQWCHHNLVLNVKEGTNFEKPTILIDSSSIGCYKRCCDDSPV